MINNYMYTENRLGQHFLEINCVDIIFMMRMMMIMMMMM